MVKQVANNVPGIGIKIGIWLPIQVNIQQDNGSDL